MDPGRIMKTAGCITLINCLALSPVVPAGEAEELNLQDLFYKSIPPSPFSEVFYGYANAMVEHGRDTRGPRKSGLFLDALDRKELSPLQVRPPAPAGVLPEHRPGPPGKPLAGANPQLDQNLLRLLYFLKGLSGDDKYPRAADGALAWFLKNTRSPSTGLYPWGRYLFWDTASGQPASGLTEPVHRFCRPWMLWERCFELAPEESRRFALALKPPSTEGGESLRQAGFILRTWAEAHAATGDAAFLKASRELLASCSASVRGKFWRKKSESAPGENGLSWAPSILSLAVDCDGAARKLPEPLRTGLARFAAELDELFCSLPHSLEKKKGFACGRYTPLWESGAGGHTTAGVAVMCVSRYENRGNLKFRRLLVAAADVYLNSLPGEESDAWPLTFGQAITLELAAFRATARERYVRRAFRLGEIAKERFFEDSPLPRASLKSDHYESTTGGDSLVLALAELHLITRTITAVRAPVNTIDR